VSVREFDIDEIPTVFAFEAFFAPVAVVMVTTGLPVVGAAFLESAFAVCLGCIMFGWLMRAGVIPEEVCEECNNFSLRSLATTSSQA